MVTLTEKSKTATDIVTLDQRVFYQVLLKLDDKDNKYLPSQNLIMNALRT